MTTPGEEWLRNESGREGGELSVGARPQQTVRQRAGAGSGGPHSQEGRGGTDWRKGGQQARGLQGRRAAPPSPGSS